MSSGSSQSEVMAGAARQQQLTRALSAVRERVDAAIAHAGRAGEAAPTLIVVTKFHPAKDIAVLASLGVRDIGESREQEASAKYAELEALPGLSGDVRWHFIGQLQSNKVRSVVRYATMLHSVDRPSLITALAKALPEQRPELAPPLECFIQVDLEERLASVPAEAAQTMNKPRGGAAPALVPFLAELIAETEGLKLAGVMAVAPHPGSSRGSGAEEAFARLAEISGHLRQEHPGAVSISAGMSADLEVAIEHGATHLRVGSDVLGPRPGVR